MSLKPTEALLKVKDLCTGYAGSQVLFDVSMSIAQGEVVALLGRNGMGKSTFIRSLFGLTTYMGGGYPFARSIDHRASLLQSGSCRFGLGARGATNLCWLDGGREFDGQF